jgi:hypothetical protein
MKLGFKQLLVTTALAGVLAPVASAQDNDNPFLRGRYTAVTERQQPEYDPEVIRAGSFQISSSLAGSVEATDNVFYQATNEESDTIFRIAPAVEARSDWTVHALTAGFTAERSEYSDHDSESTTDYNLYANGRLDVTRDFRLLASIDGGSATEPRYEPASANQPEPAQNENVGAYLGAQYRTDRLKFDGQAGARENDYQSPYYDYRDVTESYVSGRASYAISPDWAVFVQARRSEFDYDQATPVNRDATQTSLQAGVSFELSAPFAGDISVGSVKEEKDDPAQEDTDGLSLNARVQWFPTQLTTVTLSGNAGIFDPGILDATSAKYSRFTIRADHELFRNVLLFGQFGFGNYDYQASPSFPAFAREDDSIDLRAGGAYKLNKHARVELAYRMNSRESSGSLNEDVDSNTITATLRVFP